MLAGIIRFFDDPDNAPLAKDLSDVYLAAFTQPDVETVVQEIKAAFP